MILPTKHIRPDRTLLSIGGELLVELREPATVSRLWDHVRMARGRTPAAAPINYDWFVLALDLLFTIGAVELDRGLVRKTAA
ncbi:hypothetical protein K9B33_08630 [Sphingobium sp. 3R8]|uniref:ABC-three component system middle component 6 n=1 Tax=Sphingobium sp. 3R8 TaxID=2874921 RepID=UPI001CCB1C9B|nr:ABC-three component system middle component 6 [Sphingobium sp. 3R8]MBZ9647605.1 hypothetical protein [Sphingobium sp. 3R8]